jgi:hypothetical protein
MIIPYMCTVYLEQALPPLYLHSLSPLSPFCVAVTECFRLGNLQRIMVNLAHSSRGYAIHGSINS